MKVVLDVKPSHAETTHLLQDIYFSSVSFILVFSSFGVSRVVCSAHIRLLASGPRQLFSLHWWRVIESTAREWSSCTHPSTPSARLDRCQ